MGWGNLLGYIFSFIFTQHKAAKGQIFTTALQKDKSNPAIILHLRVKQNITFPIHDAQDQLYNLILLI